MASVSERVSERVSRHPRSFLLSLLSFDTLVKWHQLIPNLFLAVNNDWLLDILATSGHCGLSSNQQLCALIFACCTRLTHLEDTFKERNKKHRRSMGGVDQEQVEVSRRQFRALFAHASEVPISTSAFRRK